MTSHATLATKIPRGHGRHLRACSERIERAVAARDAERLPLHRFGPGGARSLVFSRGPAGMERGQPPRGMSGPCRAQGFGPGLARGRGAPRSGFPPPRAEANPAGPFERRPPLPLPRRIMVPTCCMSWVQGCRLCATFPLTGQDQDHRAKALTDADAPAWTKRRAIAPVSLAPGTAGSGAGRPRHRRLKPLEMRRTGASVIAAADGRVIGSDGAWPVIGGHHRSKAGRTGPFVWFPGTRRPLRTALFQSHPARVRRGRSCAMG
jgi:hypothetical protein